MNAAVYKYACYSDEFQVCVSRLKGEDTIQLDVRFFPLNYLFSLEFRIFSPSQYINK
jgi:hypothetical protein